MKNLIPVILSGGLGTRLSEYTKVIPKPMVKIGSFPIIVRIMHHYLKFGFNDFIIATGYKSFVFKKYFKNFKKDGIEFETKLLNQKLKNSFSLVGLIIKVFLNELGCFGL